MTTLPILDTERLRIRPFTPTDLDNTHQLYTQIGWVDEKQSPAEQFNSRHTYVQWNSLNHIALANLTQPPTGDRIVELKSGGDFVGACGINTLWLPMGQLPSFGSQAASPMQPEVSLMWAILPAYQNNGYATEVAQTLINALFAQFNLKRIIATTAYDNTISQRIMEKVGMRLEKNPYPDPFWLQVVGIIEREPL